MFFFLQRLEFDHEPGRGKESLMSGLCLIAAKTLVERPPKGDVCALGLRYAKGTLGEPLYYFSGCNKTEAWH